MGFFSRSKKEEPSLEQQRSTVRAAQRETASKQAELRQRVHDVRAEALKIKTYRDFAWRELEKLRTDAEEIHEGLTELAEEVDPSLRKSVPLPTHAFKQVDDYLKIIIRKLGK